MSMTNVARSGAGLMRLSLGQRLGAAAAKPGAFSYDQRNDRPAPTAMNQSRIADSNARRPGVNLPGWVFCCTSFPNNFIGLDGEGDAQGIVLQAEHLTGHFGYCS